MNTAATDLAARPEVPVAEKVRLVDALDLEPIVYKLMHPEAGAVGMTLACADRAVALYRCFLKVCILHPEVPIVPSEAIDQVWHAHVLDTAKYRADCDAVFGRFMDHFPYAGLRGEKDRRAWQEGFATTRRLFLEHFGIGLGDEPAASACSNHGDGSDCCVGCIQPGGLAVRPRPERDRGVG